MRCYAKQCGLCSTLSFVRRSNDGARVFTGSCDKTAKVWDLTTSQATQVFAVTLQAVLVDQLGETRESGGCTRPAYQEHILGPGDELHRDLFVGQDRQVRARVRPFGMDAALSMSAECMATTQVLGRQEFDAARCAAVAGASVLHGHPLPSDGSSHRGSQVGACSPLSRLTVSATRLTDATHAHAGGREPHEPAEHLQHHSKSAQVPESLRRVLP